MEVKVQLRDLPRVMDQLLLVVVMTLVKRGQMMDQVP
jgi:hypothetical protein